MLQISLVLSSPHHRFVRCCLALSLSLLLSAGLATTTGAESVCTYSSSDNGSHIQTAGAEQPRVLELGQLIQRELAGDKTHFYQVTLAANQYMRLLVNPRGLTVIVKLVGPDALKPAEIIHVSALERISVVGETAGTYRLEVQAPKSTASAGRYELKIEEVRPVMSQDHSRVAAERAWRAGEHLRGQATIEGRRGAIARYEEALAFWRVLGDKRKEALTLDRMGQAYYALGERPRALDYYQQALSLSRAAADRQIEAQTLNHLGLYYEAVNEKQQALDYLKQALPLWKATGEPQGELDVLFSLSRIYRQTGELQQAHDVNQQALVLARATHEPRQEVLSLNNLGLGYYVLGDNQRSLETFTQGLRLAQAISYRSMEANILTHLGSVYNVMGEPMQALEALTQALQLRRALADRAGEATVLQSLGRVYQSLGEPQKALEVLLPTLPLLQGLNNHTAEARSHHNLGKAYTDLGEYQQALDHLNQALQLWKLAGDLVNEAFTTHALARLESARGNLSAALARNDEALKVAELLRTKALSPDARASYFETVQKYYELEVDLLMRLHQSEPAKNHAAAALQVNESARARTLLETLAEAKIDIRSGVNAELLARERTAQEQLNAKADQLRRLLGNQHTTEQAQAAQQELEKSRADYQEIQAQLRAASPRYAALVHPVPLSLAEIQQQVVDAKTLLLEYALGEERSYLWAVTPTTFASFELPKRAEIEAAARRVYDLLTARNHRLKYETAEERRARVAQADAEYPAAAAGLSRMLLGPVAEHLADKRLLIVSDGALQYVPFAALPEPKVRGKTVAEQQRANWLPLALRHEIVSLPSATTLAVSRRELAGRRPAPKTVAVLADPVFAQDDERLKAMQAAKPASGQPPLLAQARDEVSLLESSLNRSAREVGALEEGLHIPRLPFTRREAAAILALTPATGRKAALDFAANRATATSAELGQYRFVHFATHGFLNSLHPELSGLVLSLVDTRGREQDGFLRAHEIYNLKLPAELVVLSGCRTGLGKEIKGEGLIGLTRGLLYAGAARVLVSLWDVNDEATAELMARFYRGMLGKERQRPAAALRAARTSMWQDARYQAPYYWAAFVLQGEPR